MDNTGIVGGYAMTNSNGSTKVKTSWLIPMVSAAFAVVIAVAVLTAQWQTTLDSTNQNKTNINQLVKDHEADLTKLLQSHATDIARLDESNRVRRNDIADLEERIARLEERTGGS